MSYGFAEVHYLLEEVFDGDEVSTVFLSEVERRTGHATQPLYAVLQEACYCSGTASRWASQRIRAEFPPAAPDAEQLILFGEMKDSSIYVDEARMRPFAEAMNILQAKDDWPDLYDVDGLANNAVPVAAAVYFDDLYVDADLSLKTAAHVPNLRPWVTNEFEHDGLRSEERVFARVRDLASGRA
jgi:hypothetical protein